MKVQKITIEHHDDILPYLSKRVFHVTSKDNMILINKVGYLSPNSDLSKKSLFGSRNNGFFRLRDCVSFFDYRSHGTKEWKDHAYKCFPTQGLSNNKNESISILFLHESKFKKLITWNKWKEEEAWDQQIVPYIEIGYKGIVNLDEISEELIVKFKC